MSDTMSDKGYVLVVDDEDSIRQLAVDVLEEAGYEVRSASDGEDALGVIAEATPALILLDLRMPVMDGQTLFNILRAVGDFTPVLVMSAFDAHAAMRSLGAEGAVPKPFRPEEIVAQADMLLAS